MIEGWISRFATVSVCLLSQAGSVVGQEDPAGEPPAAVVALGGLAVTGLAYDTSRQRWLAADLDGSIRAVTEGGRVDTLFSGLGELYALAASPDTELLAASGNEGLVLVSLLENEIRHRVDVGSSWCGSLAFSPAGEILAAGCRDGRVRMWDAKTGRELPHLDIRPWASAVAWSQDGRFIAAAGFTVEVWNAGSGEHLRTLRGHEGEVRSLAFSSDGEILASASLDRTVRIWTVGTGESRWVLEPRGMPVRLEPTPRVAPIRMPLSAVDIMADDERLVTAGADRTARTWSLHDGRLLAEYWGSMMSLVSIAVGPEGRIGAGSLGGEVYIWRVPDSG